MPLNKVKGNQYNHKLPNIDLLKYYYFEELMSTSEIAKKYKVTVGAVAIKFRRYKIKHRSLLEGQALHANYANITTEFLRFLNGLLLGDGCLSFTKEKKSCVYSHCDKNKEYIEWLIKYFSTFGIGCSKVTYTKNNIWAMKTKSYRNFVELKKLWYPLKERIYPKIELTPITLFNWYIGDGSHDKKSKGHKVVICKQTDDIGKAYMNNLLNEIGIKTSIYEQAIYIKKESRELFFKYITNHNYSIPNCYKYKF